MAQSNPKQGSNQTPNSGGSHSRSLSQPTFFGSHGLPPLSPYPPSETAMASSSPNLKNISMEDTDVSPLGSAAALPSPRENLNPFCSNNGLPPRRGHRRANSDVALGFSAAVQSPPQLVQVNSQEVLGRAVTVNTRRNDKPVGLKRHEMNVGNDGMGEMKPEGEVVDELIDSLMNVDGLNACGSDGKDKDSISSGSKMSYGDGSNSDSETASRHCGSSRERVKRSADGDISPPHRHSRSLSMDSGIGKFLFADPSQNMQTSLCNLADQLSPSNSLNENLAKMNLDIGHGGFSEVELKKIMADEKLAGIAMLDPKRVKRILANRQSAARSKERKLRYISELEHKVQTLQTEATTLSAQITTLQKDYTELTNQNNELKLRLQAMEQQAHLRDALHETLLAEVQRLKIVNMELREDGRLATGIARYAHVKHQMFTTQDQHPNQMQQLAATTSQSSTTTTAA